MRNLFSSCLFQSALFFESFFLGLFFITLFSEYIRILMSSTGSPEYLIPGLGVPVFFLAALSSLFLFLPRKKKDTAFYEFISNSFVVNISVFCLLYLFLSIYFYRDAIRKCMLLSELGGLLFLNMLLFLFGTGYASGIISGLFFKKGSDFENNKKLCYGLFSGMIGGFVFIQILYSFSFSYFFLLPVLFGILFLLVWLILEIPEHDSRKGILFLLFFFLILLGSGALCYDMFKHRAEMFPKTLESPEGKYEFGKYGIFFNGKSRKFYENVAEYEKMFVLAASLQNKHPGQRCIVLTNTNIWLAYAIEQMPHIDRTELLVPNEEARKTMSVFLRKSGKIKIQSGDPLERLNSIQKPCNLFFIAVSDIYSLGMHRYYMLETIEAAKQKMTDDGIFAMRLPNPPGYSEKSRKEFHAKIADTVAKVFRNVVYTSDRNSILLASNGADLTVSPDELERRMDKMTFGKKIVPTGLFYVTWNLFSNHMIRIDGRMTERMTATTEFDQELVKLSWRESPFLSSKEASTVVSIYQWSLRFFFPVLAVCLLFYILLRYLTACRMDLKMLFTSFENGFYALGVFVLFAYFFQIKTGSLYLHLATLTGLFAFGGILGGYLTERLKQTAKWIYLLAALLPFFIFLCYFLGGRTSFFWILGCMILLGLCFGYAYFSFRKKSGNDPFSVLIPSITLLGCSTGLFLMSAFFLPLNGVILCAVLLSLTRLSRIFNG